MQNCWEFMECGSEPGGLNIDEQGPCQAATNKKFDKLNRGKNGGRICWYVGSTLCVDAKHPSQTSCSTKFSKCLDCNFYNKVLDEEGENAVTDKEIYKIINEH